MMIVPRLTLVTLCLVLLVPLTAAAQAAGQVWTSSDGKSSLELRGFYKTIGSAVWIQPGLVKSTEALKSLVDRAQVAEPQLDLPSVESFPAFGATLGNTVRTWGRLLLKNRVEVSAGWQVDASILSDPAFAGGTAPGSALQVTRTQAAARRLVDFDHVLVDRGRFVLQDNLDLLAVKVTLPRGEIVAGRQVLSWGTGRLWNPTDLLSPFAPTDVDREVRHGVDAVRFSMPLGKTSLLDVLYLPQKEGWAQGGVARVQANFKGFDVSASAAKYVSDVVVGADTAGDLGPLGVHAEAAYTHALSTPDPQLAADAGQRFVRAVAGVDWRRGDWILSAEYYFNGYGAADAQGYAAKLRSDRIVRGEISGAGRHYIGFSTVWKTTELLSVQTLVISNVRDPSAIVIPVLEDWARQNVIVRAGGYIPIGARPDATALESLTVSDVVLRSDAFVNAASSLGLRSEYGSSPWGLFAQVGVYF